MRISDWSSDVCSSDLQAERLRPCLHGLVYATRDNLVRPGIRMAIPLLQDERIDIDAVEGAGEVDDLKAGGFCQLARPSPLLGLASGRAQRRQIDPPLPHPIRSTPPPDAAIDPGNTGYHFRHP